MKLVSNGTSSSPDRLFNQSFRKFLVKEKRPYSLEQTIGQFEAVREARLMFISTAPWIVL